MVWTGTHVGSAERDNIGLGVLLWKKNWEKKSGVEIAELGEVGAKDTEEETESVHTQGSWLTAHRVNW